MYLQEIFNRDVPNFVPPMELYGTLGEDTVNQYYRLGYDNYSNEKYGIPKSDGTFNVCNLVLTEITDYFYADLKSVISKIDSSILNITFNDDRNSFTVFGLEYFIRVKTFQYFSFGSTSYPKNDNDLEEFLKYDENEIDYAYNQGNAQIYPHSSHFCIYPIFYMQNDTDSTPRLKGTSKVLANTTAYSFPGRGSIPGLMSHPYYGVSYLDSIMTHKNMNYKINVHYNNNFLYITFGSKMQMNKNYPLLFSLKGIGYNGQEYNYISSSPVNYQCYTGSTYSSSANNNTVTSEWKNRITLINLNTGIIEYETNTGSTHVWDYYDKTIPTVLGLIPKDSFVKIQGACNLGFIKYDNVLVGDESFIPGKYYEIDGEVYYVPLDAVIMSTFQQPTAVNCTRKQGFYKMLLKM